MKITRLYLYRILRIIVAFLCRKEEHVVPMKKWKIRQTTASGFGNFISQLYT